jgi:hypothetical protein
MSQGLDQAHALRPLAIAVGAALLVASATNVAHAGARVAILPFQGPKAQAFERAVVAAVPRGHRLVPPARVQRALGKRHRRPASRASYAALARSLDADAIIEGKVAGGRGKRWKVSLAIRGASGEAPSGPGTWGAKHERQLLAQIGKSARPWMTAQLDPYEDPPPLPVRAPVAELGGVGGGVEDEDGDEDRGVAEPVVVERRKAADVGGLPRWEITVGPKMVARTLAFTDNVAGLPGHNLPGAVAIFAEVEAYPAARESGALRRFGVAGQIESSLGARTAGREDGRRYGTTASAFRLGPRWRLALSRATVAAGVDYGQHRVTIEVPDVVPPNVAYSYLRPGLAGRVALGARVSVGLSAAYLHVLSVGGLGDAARFPRMSALGLEASAMLGYLVTHDIEVKLGAEVRRYAHTMNVRLGDPYIVGGALDEHFGLGVALTYSIR